MCQQAGMFVDNLRRDSADRRSYDWLFFPKSLGNGKAESFAQALLDHYRGGPLKRIHFERCPGRELDDFDVWIVSCLTQYFLQDESAFGIIRRASARQHQLAIKVSFYDSVGADHSDGIFQTVEPGNLRQYGAPGINLVAMKSFVNKVGIKRDVFF